MSANTSIEWATHTFNPWWGCTKVSPACDHCYAETFARRVGYSETGSQFPIWGKDERRRFFGDQHWAQLEKWNRLAEKAGEPANVFCGSMCDVMEDRPDLHHGRVRLYNSIDDTPYLNYLLLTKRPQNFRRFLPQRWLEMPRHNVWGMTTVESPEFYWRIDALRDTPFVIRGLSIEPLLAPVPDLDLRGIHWVIAGAESGHGARPMEEAWVRSVKDQCVEAGVSFFYKQNAINGRKVPTPELDGQKWMQFPEVRNG